MEEGSLLSKVLPIIILIGSIILHEIAHGVAALWCGDSTAKEAGRLSLNPIKHIDIFGSIILPVILLVSNAGFWIGWAKPVPINLSRCRNPRTGLWVTALAGPLTNILLSIIFFVLFIATLFIWDGNDDTHLVETLFPILLEALEMGFLINFGLAFFNLCPIPPLDGSKIVASILPVDIMAKYLSLEKFGFIIIIVLANTKFFSWYIGGLMNGVLNIANSVIKMIFA